MRRGLNRSPAGAFPHEGVMLASRVQPFGVDTRAVAQAAPVSVPASSETGASIFIPFWPWPIRPFEGGLAAVVYGQDDDRRKNGNVRKGVGEIQHV